MIKKHIKNISIIVNPIITDQINMNSSFTTLKYLIQKTIINVHANKMLQNDTHTTIPIFKCFSLNHGGFDITDGKFSLKSSKDDTKRARSLVCFLYSFFF